IMGRNADVIAEMKTLRAEYKKGNMTDTTFRREKAKIQDKHGDTSPFFIVKWGGDVKYSDVINMVDELKICDVAKYALTPITRIELKALAGKTGRHYKELDTPDPSDVPAAGAPN
ncbi:MAG TPA: hypothetical protein VL651_09860, partial [Bacteroidia bacterium]|nr:hypothetical protein [Bacteroidia bacterium]